jgi:hypothetical protein
VNDPEGWRIVIRSEAELKAFRERCGLHNSNLRLTLGLTDPSKGKRRPRDCSSYCLEECIRWIRKPSTGELVFVIGNNAKNFIERVASRRQDMPFEEKQFAQLLEGTYKCRGVKLNSYTEHEWELVDAPVDAAARILAVQRPPGPAIWLSLPHVLAAPTLQVCPNRSNARRLARWPLPRDDGCAAADGWHVRHPAGGRRCAWLAGAWLAGAWLAGAQLTFESNSHAHGSGWRRAHRGVQRRSGRPGGQWPSGDVLPLARERQRARDAARAPPHDLDRDRDCGCEAGAGVGGSLGKVVVPLGKIRN